jgi:hypothetical protein
MTTYTTTLRRQRQRALALVLITLGALLAFTGPGPFGSVASAQTNTNGGVTINSINGYAAYPDDASLPPGCNAFSVLQGLQYRVDPDGAGAQPAGAPVGTLSALGNLPFGATVIMTWTGYSTGCTSVISLSVKRADGPVFDPATNQELLTFVACDAAGNGCTVAPGSYRLELTMPTFNQGGCHYQVDAVVGPPLDVVGPNGSYYSNVYRESFPNTMNETGDSMLIHANNGRGVCEPPQETTTTTVATTTTTLATTTTALATTTTTEPGTTTTTVPGSTTTVSVLGTTLTQPSTTSTTGPEVLGVTVTRPGSSNLARTGASGDGTRTLLAIGLVLAGLGVALFGRDRKLGALHQS